MRFVVLVAVALVVSCREGPGDGLTDGRVTRGQHHLTRASAAITDRNYRHAGEEALPPAPKHGT